LEFSSARRLPSLTAMQWPFSPVASPQTAKKLLNASAPASMSVCGMHCTALVRWQGTKYACSALSFACSALPFVTSYSAPHLAISPCVLSFLPCIFPGRNCGGNYAVHYHVQDHLMQLHLCRPHARPYMPTLNLLKLLISCFKPSQAPLCCCCCCPCLRHNRHRFGCS
jgi:hypothetical protein